MTWPLAFCTHEGEEGNRVVDGRCTRCGARVGAAPSDPTRPGLRRAIEAPPDVTAAELAEVVAAALHMCLPSHRVSSLWLGFAATCIAVMRRRGWTVFPPPGAT